MSVALGNTKANPTQILVLDLLEEYAKNRYSNYSRHSGRTHPEADTVLNEFPRLIANAKRDLTTITLKPIRAQIVLAKSHTSEATTARKFGGMIVNAFTGRASGETYLEKLIAALPTVITIDELLRITTSGDTKRREADLEYFMFNALTRAASSHISEAAAAAPSSSAPKTTLNPLLTATTATARDETRIFKILNLDDIYTILYEYIDSLIYNENKKEALKNKLYKALSAFESKNGTILRTKSESEIKILAWQTLATTFKTTPPKFNAPELHAISHQITKNLTTLDPTIATASAAGEPYDAAILTHPKLIDFYNIVNQRIDDADIISDDNELINILTQIYQILFKLQQTGDGVTELNPKDPIDEEAFWNCMLEEINKIWEDANLIRIIQGLDPTTPNEETNGLPVIFEEPPIVTTRSIEAEKYQALLRETEARRAEEEARRKVLEAQLANEQKRKADTASAAASAEAQAKIAALEAELAKIRAEKATTTIAAPPTETAAAAAGASAAASASSSIKILGVEKLEEETRTQLEFIEKNRAGEREEIQALLSLQTPENTKLAIRMLKVRAPLPAVATKVPPKLSVEDYKKLEKLLEKKADQNLSEKILTLLSRIPSTEIPKTITALNAGASIDALEARYPKTMTAGASASVSADMFASAKLTKTGGPSKKGKSKNANNAAAGIDPKLQRIAKTLGELESPDYDRSDIANLMTKLSALAQEAEERKKEYITQIGDVIRSELERIETLEGSQKELTKKIAAITNASQKETLQKNLEDVTAELARIRPKIATSMTEIRRLQELIRRSMSLTPLSALQRFLTQQPNGIVIRNNNLSADLFSTLTHKLQAAGQTSIKLTQLRSWLEEKGILNQYAARIVIQECLKDLNNTARVSAKLATTKIIATNEEGKKTTIPVGINYEDLRVLQALIDETNTELEILKKLPNESAAIEAEINAIFNDLTSTDAQIDTLVTRAKQLEIDLPEGAVTRLKTVHNLQARLTTIKRTLPGAESAASEPTAAETAPAPIPPSLPEHTSVPSAAGTGAASAATPPTRGIVSPPPRTRDRATEADEGLTFPPAISLALAAAAAPSPTLPPQPPLRPKPGTTTFAATAADAASNETAAPLGVKARAAAASDLAAMLASRV